MAEEKEEKFKPISPQDLTGELKEKVQFIQEEWQHNPVVANLHPKMDEELAWFEGNQYTINIGGTLINIADKVDREVKNVYNRILPVTRQTHGELSYPHKFRVEPNTTQSEDIKASKIGSNLLEFSNLNTFGKFQMKLRRASLWALITGNAFWKEWWNKFLEGYVEKKGGITLEDGNLDFGFVNPFNVRPDPYASMRDEWRYFIEGKFLPKIVVERQFDLDPGTLSVEKLDDTTRGIFKRRGEKQPSEDGIIRIEYHEKKSKDRSKGRFMVVAGGWLLYDGDNPSPKGDIGYFQIPGILPMLGSQWYESLVRIMMGPQQNFNRLNSIQDEYVQNYKLKAMIPFGGLPPGELEVFTRAGVDYVFVPMGVEKPYYQVPPAPSDFFTRRTAFMENEIETASSVRKISMGQLPKYATRASGVLFEGLKRQDETVLIPTADEINASLEDAMSYRLRLAQKHFSIPRLVKITGREKRTSTIFVEGTELRDNSDVRVTEGVELFVDKQAKREVVMTFVEKGLITEPRKALQVMNYKGMEEIYEEEFIDENQAERENEMMREKKTYPKPDPDDNHEVHFKIHNNERKKEEFETWSEDSKGWLRNHMEEHKGFQKPPTEEQPVTEGAPEEAAAPIPEGPTPAADLSPEQINELIAQMALGTPQGG